MTHVMLEKALENEMQAEMRPIPGTRQTAELNSDLLENPKHANIISGGE